MMKAKKVQGIICLVFFFIFVNQSWAENWIQYGTNSAGDVLYYDKSRMKEVDKRITSVWTKNVLSKEAKQKYFSILKSINKAPKNPSVLSYYTELLEIDYANKKIKNISVIFYNEKGDVVYSSPKSVSGQWNTIEPDSVGKKLLNVLSGEPAAPGEAVAAVDGKNQTQGKSSQADPESNLAMASRSLVSVRETGRDGRFIAYDNQTVLDTKTNLIWAAKDNGRDVNWYEAENYCVNYRGGDYTNWRMPTKNELAGLYDKNNPKHQACYPKYDIYLTNLIDLSCCCPWSSEAADSEAAYFNFDHGRWHWDEQSNDVKKMYRVLCVRSAK
ncbi:MAG: surface-adhesin E family protein [Smithellaceae bacterium]